MFPFHMEMTGSNSTIEVKYVCNEQLLNAASKIFLFQTSGLFLTQYFYDKIQCYYAKFNLTMKSRLVFINPFYWENEEPPKN